MIDSALSWSLSAPGRDRLRLVVYLAPGRADQAVAQLAINGLKVSYKRAKSVWITGAQSVSAFLREARPDDPDLHGLLERLEILFGGARGRSVSPGDRAERRQIVRAIIKRAQS